MRWLRSILAVCLYLSLLTLSFAATEPPPAETPSEKAPAQQSFDFLGAKDGRIDITADSPRRRYFPLVLKNLQDRAHDILIPPFSLKKDGKEINKLPAQTVNSPIISQPIDFTFTEVTKNAKGVETD
ncbi:MAG: hypothetical protein HGA78_10445, partial [Nitrospirales bacterium]|nr:hypothetical protein [Nitrospirales bacterium]